jgi:hypothetical protein
LDSGTREALYKSSVSALLVKSDDHKTRDKGRSRHYDTKERNAVAPQSVARGAPLGGDRAAAGMPDRAKIYVGRNSPLRGRIFLRKTLLRPSRSSQSVARGAPLGGDRAVQGMQETAPRQYRDAHSPLRGHIFLWKTLLRPSRCVPERGPRGPAKRGSGSAGDAGDRAKTVSGRSQPATGSHLPLEDTAPPFAVSFA